MEDDPRTRRAIGATLGSEGFEVSRAAGAADAISVVGTEPPELVVMGPLRGVDGVALCRRLRASGHRMPIMMVSGRDPVDDRVAGLEAGADDYLTEPFSAAELVARVRALLRRARSSAGAGALRLADLVLDLDAREAERGGRRLELTPREFDLLAYLLAHAETVLPRERLLTEAWGYPSGVETNVVDVYVGYLRRKLERGAAGRLIWTVRGIGYVLREERV